MKIQDISKFRTWFKTDHRQKSDPNIDENYVGCEYVDNKGKKTFGFYELYHGYKPNIANDLMDGLKNAQDGQAIYEFIQNAADSKSTYFGIFYNEDYFLAINNGSPFSQTDLISILNANQSSKTNEQGQAIDCDKIGRFGIGFKLVHRLVGENDGMQELTEKYKGPIVYSWSDNQISDLLDPVKNKTLSFDENAPLLFKILITNFPTYPNETVKDMHFNERTLFTNEEYKEFVNYFNEISANLDISQLKEGSMFFLKLGKNKKKLLDDQNNSLMNGVKVGLNYLKSLNSITICNNNIKKLPLNLIKFTLQPTNIINPEDPFCPINITFGYLSDYKEGMKELRASSNFYKYFPMSRENHGLNFVIHSTAFRIKTDRTQFEEDIDNTNTSIFQKFWKDFEERLKEIKSNNPNEFNNIYANLLISKPLLDDNGNKKWFYESFYTPLLNFLKQNIPTKNDFSDDAQKVKIKRLKLNLDLANFGLIHIEWFEWDNEADRLLIDEATKKLDIKEWDIRDIVENANLVNINNWIASCNNETYEAFLKELEESYLRKETIEKLYSVKLFKFSDGNFYSVNDIWVAKKFTETYQERTYNQYKRTYEYINKTRVVRKTVLNQSIHFTINKTDSISNELQNLGLTVSLKNITTYTKIYSAIADKLPKEKDIYNTIAEKCKTNMLSAEEKKNLFLNFINETTKFDNVGLELIKDLELFNNKYNQIIPIKHLIFNFNNYNFLDEFIIKEDEYFSELNDFIVSKPEEIFHKIYRKHELNIVSILRAAVITIDGYEDTAKNNSKENIFSLIDLYKKNNESFFDEYCIKENIASFSIFKKDNALFQVFTKNKNIQELIHLNCLDNLYLLPSEFTQFSDDIGIIRGEELHCLILEYVDVDEHKETLVDIVKYKAKHKFLQKLSEFRFNTEIEYTKEDYEYKILDLACSALKENDYQEFKDKVIIETEEQDLKLSEIPPFTDKIKIDNYEISLAKILPDNYENSDHLSSLINQFIGLGLNKERIGNLFGISEEPEPSDIFKIFTEQVEVLENAEQLAFLFLYGLYIEEIDFNQFKALNVNEEEIELGTDKYLTDFDFIQQSEILHQKYRGITKIFKEFPIVVDDNDNLLLIKEPYFQDDKFICPYIEENLSDEQKLSFIEFLFSQWNKKSKKTAIKNIDWSKIDDVETENILGFNPKTSVYPSKYACKSEALPDYLIKWIGKEEAQIDFLSDLGVWTERTVIVELRKFLQGEITEFHNNRLAQETRFNDDETNLFNTFEWLKENEIKLETADQFETFKKVVDVINENRNNQGDLIIEEKFDFEDLDDNSNEWEKTENYAIYMYEGEMPICVELDEVDDYIFYQYNDDNYAINENIIYLNSKEDKKKTLQKIASDDENKFTFEDLWALFSESSNREQELEREIARLQQQVAKTNNAILGTDDSNGISRNDQAEALRIAKEVVKEKLEDEGFDFSNSIDNFSIINGAIKDNEEHPLVVKSYIYTDTPFKINPIEWEQLLRKKSMLWVHFGNRKLGCIKVNELLRKQDKITISFSTENLDKEERIGKFAEVLRYFGDVHFNFDSLMPSNISDKLKYFNEKGIEKDLSGDDDSLL